MSTIPAGNLADHQNDVPTLSTLNLSDLMRTHPPPASPPLPTDIEPAAIPPGEPTNRTGFYCVLPSNLNRILGGPPSGETEAEEPSSSSPALYTLYYR